MATRTPSGAFNRFVDKKWLHKKLGEMDARHGQVVEVTVTAPQLRQMMIADGVRPEENEFSRDIIRARYEEPS